MSGSQPTLFDVAFGFARVPQEWASGVDAWVDRLVADNILNYLARPSLQESADGNPHTLQGVLGGLLRHGKNAAVQSTLRMVPYFDQWFKKYRIAEAMQIAGERYGGLSVHPDQSNLLDTPLNHHFVAEDRAGKFHALDKNAIIHLFDDQSKKASYPHLILTASHAHARHEADLHAITHGIATLASDCFKAEDGRQLRLDEAKAGEVATPKQSLIVMACEARGNFLLEGAALFRRIRELKEVERTGKPDAYKEISPAARRIAKLMLACMVEDSTQIDIDETRQLKTIFAESETTLKLKPNAIRIAQSFMLFGYSKGGNVVSDAARYLTDELMARDRNNRPIIDTTPAMRTHVDVLPDVDVQQANVRSIMRKIGLVSKGALEVEMGERYKQCGVRRLGVVNKHDLFAYNNPFHTRYETTLDDEVTQVNGNTIGFGHKAQEALGDMENGKTGYMHQHADVSRRLKEWFAPLFGKAALANVHAAADGSCVMLETVPNTSDTLFESYVPIITEAMQDAGLRHVSIVANGEAGRFRLSADGLPNKSRALDQLGAALKQLRENAKGLVIAEVSYGADIEAIKQPVGKQVAALLKRAILPKDLSNWPFPANEDGTRQFQR